MRHIAIFAIGLIVFACKRSGNQQCESFNTTISSESVLGQYDSLYAEKLGADEYGMKQYVMAILKEGPNRDQSKEEVERLQRAHLDNIIRLAEEEKLVLAGPFADQTDLKGIYIFNVESVEDARELTESDPAIQAGRLLMELHPWYGSATILEINELHKRAAKINI